MVSPENVVDSLIITDIRYGVAEGDLLDNLA